MLTFFRLLILLFSSSLIISVSPVVAAPKPVVHDAEYYILYAQNKAKWDEQDKALREKLNALQKKYGTPPNIVHIMWDDTSFGDVGIPAINKIRGYQTPHINKLAQNGILFTRMYTEPSCTPTRAAALTGRHPVRNGMYVVGFPIENGGLSKDEVTLAEVLSKAGYTTGFFGKAHVGDIEESYLNNQGFDEAFWMPYNQVVSLWNEQGEAANAVIGLKEEMLVKDPYKLDNTFIPKGWIVALEGKKGQPAYEWRGTSHEDYLAFDTEAKKRTIEFIRKNAKTKKPFYVVSWPALTSFIPSPKKLTPGRGIFTDAMQHNVDAFVGTVVKELKDQGIAENTLIIVMADNGPMSHNPPPGLGMVETIFRGGKGDFLEGGVRVPAFAYWPGVIEKGQLVGDIVHVTDLFTTFANIGGAKQYIPRDRVIDGLDQTALILNGDTHGRRDYVFIYQGPILAATVKGNNKRHWITSDPGAKSGIGAATYFLPLDPREKTPMLANLLHTAEAFGRMRARHELWKKKYPDKSMARAIAFTGIANARPETKNLAKPPYNPKDLPFDVNQYLEFKLPWFNLDPDYGQ
jgi:arylsulfatase